LRRSSSSRNPTTRASRSRSIRRRSPTARLPDAVRQAAASVTQARQTLAPILRAFALRLLASGKSPMLVIGALMQALGDRLRRLEVGTALRSHLRRFGGLTSETVSSSSLLVSTKHSGPIRTPRVFPHTARSAASDRSSTVRRPVRHRSPFRSRRRRRAASASPP